MNHPDPLAGLPNTLDTTTLEQMAKPKHRVLAEFIHGCSPDPATRTAATTALVLSLWHLVSPSLTSPLPSLILLDAGETVPDPIDELVKLLVCDEESNKPRTPQQGAFVGGTPDLAPTAMAGARHKLQELDSQSLNNPFRQQEARQLEERYEAAQRAGFGSGHSRPYSQAWHENFGLLTDTNDQLVLRLNEAQDRAGFRNHVLESPETMKGPRGIVIGVAGLAWHGLGFDPGCPQKKARRVINDLRKKGPMTKSAILQTRAYHQSQRDVLLERLVAEGLVRVDGSTVTASTYAEFVDGLYVRPEFPEPSNAWAAATEGSKVTA